MAHSDASLPATKPSPEPPRALPAAPQRHAIAPVRDRMQSELLVWGWIITVLPLAFLLFWVKTSIAWDDGKIWSGMQMHGVYISLFLTGLVILMRAATPSAAAVGGVICYTMTLETTLLTRRLSETALPTLIALFILTFAATRFGQARKSRLGLAEEKRGRATSQIVANLGVASAVALLHGVHSASAVTCIAVLAEATADTVSSELGPLLRGRTVLITTLKPVRPGTDGGISWKGTACGIVAAILIVLAGVITMRLTWLETKIGIFAALVGFFADSLLGATLERRGVIGNDLVNFLSTATAAIIAFPLAALLLP